MKRVYQKNMGANRYGWLRTYEECDELCHGNWIEIESLQRQVAFLKKLLEENRIVLPDDYYDLWFIQLYL